MALHRTGHNSQQLPKKRTSTHQNQTSDMIKKGMEKKTVDPTTRNFHLQKLSQI
ncbi:hypothetical protein Bca101_073491 [Brassica carinata]